MFSDRKKISGTALASLKGVAGRRKKVPQVLAAADSPDALLTIETVKALSGLGKTSIYKRIASGELHPVRMGTRCTRFRAGEVRDWLRNQGSEDEA